MGSARELEYSVLVEIKGWMARLGNHHFHQRVQIDALACSNQQCSNETKNLIVDFALHINKGESLSYQYHRVKDETIYLMGGLMELEIGDERRRKTQRLEPGASLHIAPGTRHRMTALEDCEVLEVSTPELEDVVRLEDRYGRVGPEK
jgi:quercetin dioxygenase-like cupin family protein